jgi:hypothetical protein
MKKCTLLVPLLILAASCLARAQVQPVQATLNSASTGACTPTSCLTYLIPSGVGSAGVSVVGSSGTVTFEVFDVNGNYAAVNVTPSNSGTDVSTASVSGTQFFQASHIAGQYGFRVRLTASGSAAVTINPSTASARAGGGGGPGWSGAVSCSTVDAFVYWLTSTTGQCDPGITTNTSGQLSATEGFVAASDGVHAGTSPLIGNTTLPPIVVNTYQPVGPPLASYTAWEDQPAGSTSGGPGATSLKVSSTAAGSPLSSQWTFATPAAPITLSTSSIGCATCVTSSSPGVGIAHFAGSTQAVTSSAVNLASADVTGVLPQANSTYQVLDVTQQTDSVNCPNNTTSNFATTYTIPANQITANKLLRITLGFALTTSGSPPTMAMNLSIGGTSVYTPLASTPQASVAGRPYAITFMIQGTAAAGASVATQFHPEPPGGLQIVANAPFNVSTTSSPINLATNGTMVIQPILFCGANTAGNSMNLQQFIVEKLN